MSVPRCALQFQLRILQTVADLIVADLVVLGAERYIEAAFESRDLRIAKLLQLAGCRRVMSMTIDDHDQYMRAGLSTRIRR